MVISGGDPGRGGSAYQQQSISSPSSSPPIPLPSHPKPITDELLLTSPPTKPLDATRDLYNPSNEDGFRFIDICNWFFPRNQSPRFAHLQTITVTLGLGRDWLKQGGNEPKRRDHAERRISGRNIRINLRINTRTGILLQQMNETAFSDYVDSYLKPTADVLVQVEQPEYGSGSLYAHPRARMNWHRINTYLKRHHTSLRKSLLGILIVSAMAYVERSLFLATDFGHPSAQSLASV